MAAFSPKNFLNLFAKFYRSPTFPQIFLSFSDSEEESRSTLLETQYGTVKYFGIFCRTENYQQISI